VRLTLPDGLATGRAYIMATITAIKVVPHTRIENSIIDNMADIGVYGYAVYSMIKRHLNHKTTQCNPSYATIARKIGIDRGTVIRYVKKLKALNLVSPLLRFKEDGSLSSNQYNFSMAAPAPSHKEDSRLSADRSKVGSGTEPPPLGAENNQGSGTEPPKQSSSSNKKERTIAEVDLTATEKQKTCPHPPSEIVFLSENVIICNHCYGLLDENLRLVQEDQSPTEGIYAA
jgi:hypothetical protein